MNDESLKAPPIPTEHLRPLMAAKLLPLGENPADCVPIPGLIGAAEAILREPRRVLFHLRQGRAGVIAWMLAISVVCILVYGVIVGTFSGGEQLYFAPLKIALGMLVSALICLPSLYIFACLGGSRARLAEVFGMVSGLLALMTVLLIGFAPVAWIFSQSTNSVVAMGALHLLFWFVAACFGLRFLVHGFSHTGGSSGGLKVWIVIFVLVCLQMTTALRPIVGTANTFFPTEKKFFLNHWIDSSRK